MVHVHKGDKQWEAIFICWTVDEQMWQCHLVQSITKSMRWLPTSREDRQNASSSQHTSQWSLKPESGTDVPKNDNLLQDDGAVWWNQLRGIRRFHQRRGGSEGNFPNTCNGCTTTHQWVTTQQTSRNNGRTEFTIQEERTRPNTKSQQNKRCGTKER